MDKLRICDVDGCDKPHRAKGYCSGHYQQIQAGRSATPIGGPRIRKEGWGAFDEPEDFFWGRVKKTESCWVWHGKKTVTGYGQIKFRGDTGYAHRFSWELEFGPVPDEGVIDHLCHNPSCVNPAHLRLTTTKGNGENRRGASSLSKSGVRGAYLDPGTGRWTAQVVHHGKKIRTRGFATAEAAGDAARRKRQEVFPVSS